MVDEKITELLELLRLFSHDGEPSCSISPDVQSRCLSYGTRLASNIAVQKIQSNRITALEKDLAECKALLTECQELLGEADKNGGV